MQHFLLFQVQIKLEKIFFLSWKSFYEISACAILIRFWFEICVRFHFGFPGNVSDRSNFNILFFPVKIYSLQKINSSKFHSTAKPKKSSKTIQKKRIFFNLKKFGFLRSLEKFLYSKH
jgi:hypothetical protein